METVGATHTIVYSAQSSRPWCVIRLADGALIDACFEEETARRMCAIQTIRSLPVGTLLYHKSYRRVGKLLRIDSSHAIVQVQGTKRRERWTLGLLEPAAQSGGM